MGTTEEDLKEVKRLLQTNLGETRHLTEMVQSIKKHILFQEIFNIVKVILIVVPLILAVIYAVPFMKQLTTMYHDAVGLMGSSSKAEMQELLKGLLK